MSSAGSATNTPNSSSNNRWTEWLLYSYFNWRKDTISDLVLFAGLNFGLVFIVWLLTLYTHVSDSLSLYAIGQILVGQELPEESSIDMGTQVFVVSMGLFGLASFAVVLALVEQAVLEILEANVRQGSNVIEEDHVVLLSWGTSTRDIAQTIRIVKEICASQQYSWIKKGRLSIVVLSQGREKLEMESLFDRALPESMRAGCRLVFRQGSPLDPGALDMVSVATAKTVIISGDYSARCRESDAQVRMRRWTELNAMCRRLIFPPHFFPITLSLSPFPPHPSRSTGFSLDRCSAAQFSSTRCSRVRCRAVRAMRRSTRGSSSRHRRRRGTSFATSGPRSVSTRCSRQG